MFKKRIVKWCEEMCTENYSLSVVSFTAKQNIIHVCIQNDFLFTPKLRSGVEFSVYLCVFACGWGGGTVDFVLIVPLIRNLLSETLLKPIITHRSCTQTHAHTFNDKCTSTCAHARIHMHAHTHTHTHTHTHACTQTHAHTLTNTHTHTHTHTRHENRRRMSARFRLVRRTSSRLVLVKMTYVMMV